MSYLRQLVPRQPIGRWKPDFVQLDFIDSKPEQEVNRRCRRKPERVENVHLRQPDESHTVFNYWRYFHAGGNNPVIRHLIKTRQQNRQQDNPKIPDKQREQDVSD